MATNKDTFDPKAYKTALENVKKLTKAQEDLNNTVKTQEYFLDGISNRMLGISGSDWFTKVPKTTEDIKKQAAVLGNMQKELIEMGKGINSLSLEGFTSEGIAAAEKLSESFTSSSDIIAASFKDKSSDEILNFQKELTAEIAKQAEGAKLSKDDLASMAEKYKELGVTVESIESIESAIKDSNKDQEELFENVLDLNEGLVDVMDERLQRTLAIAIGNNDITGFIKEQGEAGKVALAQAGMMTDELGDMIQEHSKLNDKAEEFKKETLETHKNQFKIQEGFKKIAQNLAGDVLKGMSAFDNAINSAQQKFGINMDNNRKKMSDLVIQTASFGMSVEDTTEFMGMLSDEIRSTDTGVLAEAADNMKAVNLATGLSYENMTKWTGEMMLTGKSSKEVEKSMANANVTSKQFGVNTRKVMEGVAANLEKMRTMGFTGGVESLTRMVAEAERLKINIDEVFDMSAKARNIEGAMKMASELQLAGGSFAQINPMELLAAARKGPEEMQKILTQMGGDIGDFNDENEFEFDAVDKDRLQIMADATGVSLNTMTNMIRKQAIDNKKLNLFPEEMFSVEGFDSKAVQAKISDAIEIGEDGELTLKSDDNIFGAKTVADLRNLSETDIIAAMEEQKAKDEQLAEQARQNQSLAKSMTAFKDVLVNLFTIHL